MTESTQRQKVLWIIGTIVVLFYALIPVALDHVAVTEGPDDDRRPEVLPVEVDVRTTTTPSSRAAWASTTR